MCIGAGLGSPMWSCEVLCFAFSNFFLNTNDTPTALKVRLQQDPGLKQTFPEAKALIGCYAKGNINLS